MVLSDLTTAAGVSELVRVTGGTESFFNHPDRAMGIAAVVQNAIATNSNLANVKVRIMPNLPNCVYNYDRGEVILGLVNPDALAHELGHANRLRQDGLYRKILTAANGVARINNVIAVPTMLALRMFIKDPAQRNDILQSLSALSAAAAAPGLTEEMAASISALRDSPNRLQSLGTLGPAYLAHFASSMMPSAIYEAGRT